jgi:hypothetical protein
LARAAVVAVGRCAVRTKSSAVIALSIAVFLAAVAGGAGAGSGRLTRLRADLVLRPDVPRDQHPAVAPHGLYGAFDATYNPGTGRLGYGLRYKGLDGFAFRVEIRSRATGETYAVLCEPCQPALLPKPGHEGLPVSHLSGVVSIDPDTAFLITHERTFVEVDTTAYPSGEIGAPIFEVVPVARYAPPPPKSGYGSASPTGALTPETPRCC